MPCHETHGFSQRDDGSKERTYIIYDVTDDAQALGLAQATAPADLRPTPQSFPTHTRNPDPTLKQIGYSLYEVVFTYTPLVAGDVGGGPSELELAFDGLLTFDSTAGSQHITQALNQKAYGEDCSDLEKSRTIGASGSSVEGVDLVVPKLTYSITKIPPVAKLASLGTYSKDLGRLVGMTNAYPYTLRGWLIGRRVAIEFQSGELMFMGGSPTSDGRIKYDFDASENRTNVTIAEYNDGQQPIKLATKKGHEIVWTLYKQKELTKPAVAIFIPRASFVAQISPDDNFETVLGF